MNDFNPAGAAAPQNDASVDSLQRACAALRTQFHALLGLLVLLAGSLGIYLYCQVVLVQRQIEEQQRLLADYQQNAQPAIQDFLNKMQTFAKTSPEFAPIFGKFVPTANASVPPVPAKK